MFYSKTSRFTLIKNTKHFHSFNLSLDEYKLLLERNFAEEFIQKEQEREREEVNSQLKWNKRK